MTYITAFGLFKFLPFILYSGGDATWTQEELCSVIFGFRRTEFRCQCRKEKVVTLSLKINVQLFDNNNRLLLPYKGDIPTLRQLNWFLYAR